MIKGIILAGGSGTRLYPLTMVTSKQLLPVYDKPMIYYPMSILMMAGIRDILIISTPTDTPKFENLLGDGKQFGLNLKYKVQKSPDGLPQAFILGEEFLKDADGVCMILGDNIFYGGNMTNILKQAKTNIDKKIATVFGYHVLDPERFGVVEFDKNHKVISLEEKPKNPKSNYAVVGLYFYDKSVIDYAKSLKPSSRNELEISDLNNIYLKKGLLDVIVFNRGVSWMDAGTHQSLADATAFIKMVEDHQGLKIGCLEEIAYHNKWITNEQLLARAKVIGNNQYGQYLKMIAKNVK